MTDHDSPIEWFYVLLSCMAVSGTGWFYIRAVQNVRLNEIEHVETPIKIVALDKRDGSRMRWLSALVALVAGIVIIFIAPPPPSYSDAPQSLVLLAALAIKQAITVYCSWRSWFHYRVLAKLAAANEAGDL